jgi:hypothetical protein
MYRTRVGVDLAKEVIQFCTYTRKKVGCFRFVSHFSQEPSSPLA